MKKRIEVFLFVDALGWELVRETHFMERELPERRKIRMQFAPRFRRSCRGRRLPSTDT